MGYNIPIYTTDNLETLNEKLKGSWKDESIKYLNNIIELFKEEHGEIEDYIIICDIKDRNIKFSHSSRISDNTIIKKMRKIYCDGHRKHKLLIHKEFGNGSIGGYRGEGGFKFENHVHDLIKDKHYDNNLVRLIFSKLKIEKENIKSIRKEGRSNKRTIYLEDENIFIKNNSKEKIADLTIKLKDETEIPLSLKSGNLVTFINAGINTSIMIWNDIESDDITRPVALTLFKILGINAHSFCKVFNLYKNKKFDEMRDIESFKTTSFEGEELTNLIKLCIGNKDGYILHKLDEKYIMYRITDKFLNHIKPTSLEVEYGGSTKIAKRVNIIVKTDIIKFTFNFRNKSRGIYPTHMMCDFKYTKKFYELYYSNELY